MDVICFRAVSIITPETLAEYVTFVEDPGRRWLFYYVTVQDVARAFRLALEASDPSFSILFLTAADTSRPEPTLEWYPERVGPLPEVIDQPLYDRNPRASVFSSAKARAVLGWEPTSNYLDLREGSVRP